MDYLDKEAQESDDEEELTEQERRRLKKVRAESDEDEDEDEEAQYADELKDFIADNNLEEESDDSGDEKRRKRKRSDDEAELDDQLEDDDYDLLEENLGIRVQRKRFRRVQVEDSDDEEPEVAGEEGSQEQAVEASDEEGHDEGEAAEADEARGGGGEGGDSDMDNDLDNFIVDEDGNPITVKGKKKRRHFIPDGALQDAQDIFGVEFDYGEMEALEGGEAEEAEEDDEDAENEYEDEEDGYERDEDEDEDEGGRAARKKSKAADKEKKARKKVPKQSIFELYEPTELERGHFTDKDHEIRNTDVPERFQTRAIPVQACKDGSEDKELHDEAEWIYRQAFSDTPVSQQGIQDVKPAEAVPKIRFALDFMRNGSLEVPFIVAYRKEYIEPELNTADLWKIYKWDEKWCQLKSRKDKLTDLLKNVMEYQQDLVMQNPDKPLPDDMKVVKDEDMERVQMAETPEEFQDVYNHFLLYHHHYLQPMQESRRESKRKAIEEKRRAREERRAARMRPKMKTITVKRTVIDEETGEEKEIEVEEEVEASDQELEEEPQEEEEIIEELEAQENCKLPIRRDPYNVCRRAGLAPLSGYFGLPPEKFGENVRLDYHKNDVNSDVIDPLERAKDYVCTQFPEPEDVLKAATFMMANQIAMEPAIRKAVREKIMREATVNVRPTKKGFKEIDESHVLYSFKYLTDKPVSTFEFDSFLALVMGEEDQLITIDFNCDVQGRDTKYIEHVKQFLFEDKFSSHVLLWNEVRGRAVQIAFEQFLWPGFRKELKRRLTREARGAIIDLCARKMADSIKIAPFHLLPDKEDDEDWDTTTGFRIMSIAYAPDPSLAAFACCIDIDGDVCDVLRLPALLKRKNSFKPDDRIAKEKDLKNLYNLILRRKPHVVAIGSESRDAIMIAEDVREILTELSTKEHFPTDISVEFVNNDFSKIYSNSIKGQNDFKEYPELLRQAVSIGRRMQDPLMEFSQLCTVDEELVCVPFHPLQAYLAKDEAGKAEVLEALYREMINKVNEVGVDLNRCLTHPYTMNLLQFVSGLGPRKAAALLKTLRQKSQRLENRTQLVTVCHLGPKVFVNCAGFLRIDTNSLGDSADSYVEVLDSTRVHPETYEWARKMAVDALEYDELGYDANPAAALEEILECPERLKDLDLDAFAVELERQGYGKKKLTLEDIRNELNHRYADHRVPYARPEEDDKFAWFTKETPDTFYVGKLILATVTGFVYRKPETVPDENGDDPNQAPRRNEKTGLYQCQVCLRAEFQLLEDVWVHMDDQVRPCLGRAVGVRLRLDNGLSGFIPIKFLSDSEVIDPERRVRVGQVIQCRVTKMNVEKYSVECTSRTTDLLDKEGEWRPDKDKKYDMDLEEREIEKDREQRKITFKKKNAYMSRVIVHPNFHNIDYAGAEARMASLQQGDVIIRPSSQGVDHLTVTWKVADGVHQHIDVKEKHKENAFSLGKSLWINGEEFEDLDEIVARHINPMAAHARDILNYKYYRDTQGGIRENAEEILREEKRKAPSKIPYIISVVAKEMPGKFMLSYQPRLKARHEYVTVTPEGFRYRRQHFDTLNSMLKWFKEHHRDPIPNTPGAHSVANVARTPGGFSLASASRDVIRQTAQNIPSHIYNAISQVVVTGGQTPHTPHYAPHTPHTPYTHYTQTPYTPSGQTPYMTPYQTPRAVSVMQAHGSVPMLPGQAMQAMQGMQAMHAMPVPGMPVQRQPATPNYNNPAGRPWPQSTPQMQQHGNHRVPQQHQQQVPQNRAPPASRTPGQDLNQWHKAIDAWTTRTSRPMGGRTPRTPGMTPRYEESRRTPGTPVDRRTPRQPAYADGTPLYDE